MATEFLTTADTQQYSSRLQALGRIGVLFGGISAEREVSLQSGAAVVRALQALGADVSAIDVQQDAIAQIQAAALDCVFIALHGKMGEDGRVQALLEFMGLPYTGSGVQASSIAMDKWRSKQIFSASGLPTPDYQPLTEATDLAAVIASLGADLMVKPAHEGSSIGMSKVAGLSELQAAFALARKFDSSVFAERVVVGSEYTVAILGNEALPPIKLETDNTFYDFEAKYVSDETRYICPCGLDQAAEAQLRTLALQAFNALGCSGWGRVDFMADAEGNFYILEVNTVPGMTSHSLVPMAAGASGMSFAGLVATILLQAVEAR